MSYTPLPIGVDDFEKLRTNEYYYVDKTLLIKELIDKKGEVNLFTRPRRFGKTLNLSMLKYFFEKPIEEKSNKYLFAGLKIMECGEKYTGKQEQYPVITLTLKSAKQGSYSDAFGRMKEVISDEFKRHRYVLEHIELKADQEKFYQIMSRTASEAEYLTSLAFLSKCLYDYHQQKAIILIDEYDVPLENAYYTGFYDEMIRFIRSLFESALKTNAYLEFAVITGCLRISKESIFTGLNNLKIISILNEEYGEHFGFVEEEVSQMLSFYGRESRMDTMKQWYDGYRFGETEVYNPWSVINFTEKIYSKEDAFPTAAWSNTSSNSIVRDLIYHAGKEVKDEIERLMSGGCIEKKVHEDITYDDIHESEENLWNFLFFTGYLKQISMRMEGVNRYVTMAIPNNELLYIYENTIEKWFREEIKVQDFTVLYEAMFGGETEVFEEETAMQLRKSISYMDHAESFYHGFLLGLMANLREYSIKSNRESGDGRYDICVYQDDVRLAPVLLELKVVRKYTDLEDACDRALQQIEEKDYTSGWGEEGYTQMLCYGVAFYKKNVRIKLMQKRLR
ncbi:MAG TPA: AAA family ATPase [Lachnospiraceae bacterium]|nr:AAA family ATPase [Lachnospiraceae bacterium]